MLIGKTRFTISIHVLHSFLLTIIEIGKKYVKIGFIMEFLNRKKSVKLIQMKPEFYCVSL